MSGAEPTLSERIDAAESMCHRSPDMGGWLTVVCMVIVCFGTAILFAAALS